jgi:putative transposase
MGNAQPWIAISMTAGEPTRVLFRAHMAPTLIDEIRTVTNGNYVLGNDRFKEDVARMLERRVTPGKSGRPRRTTD